MPVEDSALNRREGDTMYVRNQRARTIFILGNREPYCCFWCGELVDLLFGATRWALAVHHIDEDVNNNDLSNLLPAHCGCHRVYHAKKQASVASR